MVQICSSCTSNQVDFNCLAGYQAAICKRSSWPFPKLSWTSSQSKRFQALSFQKWRRTKSDSKFQMTWTPRWTSAWLRWSSLFCHNLRCLASGKGKRLKQLPTEKSFFDFQVWAEFNDFSVWWISQRPKI